MAARQGVCVQRVSWLQVEISFPNLPLRRFIFDTWGSSSSQSKPGWKNRAKAEIFKTKSVKPRWRKGKPASTDDSPERSTSAGDSSAASVASPDETQDKAAATWRSLALGGSLLAITNGEHYGEDCEGASSKDEAPTAGNERQTQLAETQLAETQLDIDQEMPKDPDMLRWLKSQPLDSGCSDEKEEMRSSPTHVVVVDDSDEGSLPDVPWAELQLMC